MKVVVSIVFLMTVLYGATQNSKPSGQGTLREQVLYNLDVKRAQDLESSWRGLLRHRDKDHYVRVTMNSSRSVHQHELVSLERHGSLVNLKFVGLEDDDDWFVLSIRATKVTLLEVTKRPW